MRVQVRSALAALAVAIVAVLIWAPTANAQESDITANVTVDGRDVAASVSGEPIPLYPEKISDVTVEVTNKGTEPIEIASVQLIGRVLGLTFFNYSTGVELTVAPGDTKTVKYDLDLTDLERQATGLMDTQLVVRTASRDTLVKVDAVADIRGSLISVYGLLGLALLVLTVLAIINAVIVIVRQQGSPNRLRRGLLLLSPGIGIGLVLAFTASVARWWVPRTELWLLIAAVTGAIAFALGYFSPTPGGEDADDEDDEPMDSDVAEDDQADVAEDDRRTEEVRIQRPVTPDPPDGDATSVIPPDDNATVVLRRER